MMQQKIAEALRWPRIVLLLVATFLLLTDSAIAVPRTDCFPFERLEARLQAKARKVLLKTLDREALYTLLGPLKPWSTCGETLTIPAQSADQAEFESEISDLKSILSAFRCGDDIEGKVHVYAQPHDGVRFADPFVFKRSSARKRVAEASDFFHGIGVSQDALPLPDVLKKVEEARRYDRFRGYGLLFGYPAQAVDFFVKAAEIEDQTGEFVTREFINIPTFASPSGHFVWAVPVGHQETAEETTIRTTASSILARYRDQRRKWIDTADSPSASPQSLELIREWFHDGKGDYSPEHARF